MINSSTWSICTSAFLGELEISVFCNPFEQGAETKLMHDNLNLRISPIPENPLWGFSFMFEVSENLHSKE